MSIKAFCLLVYICRPFSCLHLISTHLSNGLNMKKSESLFYESVIYETNNKNKLIDDFFNVKKNWFDLM